MKNLLLIIVLSITLFSCNTKETVKPNFKTIAIEIANNVDYETDTHIFKHLGDNVYRGLNKCNNT